MELTENSGKIEAPRAASRRRYWRPIVGANRRFRANWWSPYPPPAADHAVSCKELTSPSAESNIAGVEKRGDNPGPSLVGVVSGCAQTRSSHAQEVVVKPQPLFDGKDLTGWERTYRQRQ